jgi:ABC-type dipeptide/oligopeptide/nickel transport system ATPase component
LGTIKDKLENVFAAFCNEEGKILNERVKIDFSLNIKKEECIDIIEKDHALDSSFCGNFPREILLRIIGERGIDEVIGALRKGSFDSWQEWENIGPRTVEYLNNIINKEEIAMRLEEILPALSFGLKWRVAPNYKPLTECSIGERSTAVLSVILVSGTIPLIIDQPEDDLDHSYIFKPLTDIIKHVKKKRQLIFTTHNANIVINGDAEQILIMETEDGKHGNITISTIEDIERRNKLLSILEGGKEAFENREKKYDFK